MSSAALETLFTDDVAVEPPPAPSIDGKAPVGSIEAEDSFLTRLDRMSSRQRVKTYRAGGFSREERAVWACRYPDEVPIINGEREWLVLGSADLD